MVWWKTFQLYYIKVKNIDIIGCFTFNNQFVIIFHDKIAPGIHFQDCGKFYSIFGDLFKISTLHTLKKQMVVVLESFNCCVGIDHGHNMLNFMLDL
jgi:hypothetical protein